MVFSTVNSLSLVVRMYPLYREGPFTWEIYLLLGKQDVGVMGGRNGGKSEWTSLIQWVFFHLFELELSSMPRGQFLRYCVLNSTRSTRKKFRKDPPQYTHLPSQHTACPPVSWFFQGSGSDPTSYIVRGCDPLYSLTSDFLSFPSIFWP